MAKHHADYRFGVRVSRVGSFMITNVPLSWEDVDKGEATHVYRVHGKSLYSQFCWEPKTANKKSLRKFLIKN